MNLPQLNENIKAESFLASFIEDESKLEIETKGVFSRNYAEDIIGMDIDEYRNNKITVRLSRDSVFHVLPENLFFNENKLREIAKSKDSDKFKQEEERIRKEKEKILLFFQPFDATYFKALFKLEKEVNAIAENRTQFLLDTFFDVFDLDSGNPLIRKIIPLLPLASEFRGNKMLLKDVLKNVFYPANIEIHNIRKRHSTGIVERIMKIIIHIEKLTSKEFMTLKRNTDDFAHFFYEWFLPVDMGYEFKIKDKKELFILGNTMTLDYNTYLR